MITSTHALMAATVGRALQRRNKAVHFKWLLIGGVAPDVMLYGLSIGYFIALAWFQPAGERVFGPLYDQLYFTNPFWIVGYNLFHAPLMIAALLAVGYAAMRRAKPWGALLFWFAVGCGVHSLGDIPTHHNDGPLLLFPFNWEMRYHAPISYWHDGYYGREFAFFELFILTPAMVLYLASGWLRRKLALLRSAFGKGDIATG